VNTIWNVQVCCTFSVAGQLLVCVNVPPEGDMASAVVFTDDAPSLVTVALCVLLEPTGTFPRLRLAGVNPRAPLSPVPLSVMVYVGLPGQLSLRVTAPVRVPAAVGEKVIVIVQFCPGSSVVVVGQVLLWEKSPLLAVLVKVAK